jgi:thiol-disulfide isomerase/thioredoxin
VTASARQLWIAVVLMSLASCSRASSRLPDEGAMPSLDQADTWIDSAPLTASDLRGKVVLFQFWTYTCINWMRTLPHVRAWAEKYRDQGLIVIGVHTPEFSFEKRIENVKWAANALDVPFAVAVDSDYGIWNAFGNNYWPALYITDAQGRIRHHHFGEGGYEHTERVIQELLAETGHSLPDRQPISVKGRGLEADADWKTLGSPETYLGYARAQKFASPGGMSFDTRHTYTAPERLLINQWALTGDWTVKEESAALGAGRGRISYRFHARDVHLVLAPTVPDTSVRFRVLLDGKAPASAHGLDVDEQGNGSVSEPRMHQLIRQTSPIEDRLFEIEFLDPGLEAFVFTFG